MMKTVPGSLACCQVCLHTHHVAVTALHKPAVISSTCEFRAYDASLILHLLYHHDQQTMPVLDMHCIFSSPFGFATSRPGQ